MHLSTKRPRQQKKGITPVVVFIVMMVARTNRFSMMIFGKFMKIFSS